MANMQNGKNNLFHGLAIERTNDFVNDIKKLYKKFNCKFSREAEGTIWYSYCVVWNKIIRDIERGILYDKGN